MCRQASGDGMSDNGQRLGAAVAFYTLLSLAPVIVIAVALAAVVYERDAAEGRLASEIARVAGPAAAKTIQEIIKGGNQPRIGAIATLLGLAILAFGASSVFFDEHHLARVASPSSKQHGNDDAPDQGTRNDPCGSLRHCNPHGRQPGVHHKRK
jgi:uncharacterized BrkB/YihY/UPF0761 family membrane protein